MEWYWTLLIGIVVGWLTKSPFLIKYYKRIRADKIHMQEIVENFEKANKKTDGTK